MSLTYLLTVPLVRVESYEAAARLPTAFLQVFVPKTAGADGLYPAAPPQRIVVWSHPPCHRIVEIKERVEAEAMLSGTEDAVHVVLSEIPSDAVERAVGALERVLAELRRESPGAKQASMPETMMDRLRGVGE